MISAKLSTHVLLIMCYSVLSFQFSVFSNNKLNPNGPINYNGVYQKKKKKKLQQGNSHDNFKFPSNLKQQKQY